MKHYLFSYGTLQIEKTQILLFKKPLKGYIDILIGWKVSQIKISDGAFLALGESAVQRIAVFTNDDKDFIRGAALVASPKFLVLLSAPIILYFFPLSFLVISS
jgi:hypothetical protein